MPEYTYKNLSRTAKAIITHLVQHKHETLLCPTTGLVIPIGTDYQWVEKLGLKSWGKHYTWMGFSYILVLDVNPSTPDRPLYDEDRAYLPDGYDDRVNIYQRDTTILVGHSLTGNGLFTDL